MNKNTLRDRAELLLEQERTQQKFLDSQEIVHELNVHQIELELQNEELREVIERLSESQKETEKSNQAFRQLYEKTPIGYVVINQQGIICHCNATALNQFQIEKKKVLGTAFVDYIAPDDQAIWWSRFKGFIQHPEGKILELNLLTGDKQCKTVEITATLLEDWVSNDFFRTENYPQTFNHLNTQYYLLTLLDITQRKKAQANLQFQQQALDQHAIVSITDSSGHIIYANDKFAEVSGYSQIELIGQTHRLLKSDFHSPEFYEQMWHKISIGEVWHGNIKNKAKNGSYYWVASTIVPRLNEQGGIDQYIAIRTEITQIKALEEKQKTISQHLAVEKKKADQANKAKSDFLSAMSHELRTPLNAILGFAQLLKFSPDTRLSSEQQECIDFIVTGGEHLLQLINDILELSAIEAGKLKLCIEDIALNNMLPDLVSLMQNIAVQKNVQITSTDFPDDLLIRADITKIKQVLLNLISNAIKYNVTDGSVDINWQILEDQRIRINIKDTGIGISEEKQNQVFDSFNRLGHETSAIFGSGIGLTVTKQLVESMGGKIGFESEVGMGSTFWIELLLAETKKLTEQEKYIDLTQTLSELSRCETTKRILYVEDNQPNQKIMAAFFKKHLPFELIHAISAEHGQELLTQQAFDLILMDIHLPGMNGDKFCRLIKSNPNYQDIPVIAVSADAMQHRIKQKYQLFDEYITKPIIFAELTNCLLKFLHRDEDQL